MFDLVKSFPIDPLPEQGLYDAKLDNILYDETIVASAKNAQPLGIGSLARFVFIVQFGEQAVQMCKLYPTPDDDETAMLIGLSPWLASMSFEKKGQVNTSELKGKSCRVLITHGRTEDGVFADIEAILPSVEDANRMMAEYKSRNIQVVALPEIAFAIMGLPKKNRRKHKLAALHPAQLYSSSRK